MDDLPSTKTSAAEQGKLSPNESRHQLHPNEFLNSRHQGKHITPPVETRVFLYLVNGYNKKTQGVQAAESHKKGTLDGIDILVCYSPGIPIESHAGICKRVLRSQREVQKDSPKLSQSCRRGLSCLQSYSPLIFGGKLIV